MRLLGAANVRRLWSFLRLLGAGNVSGILARLRHHRDRLPPERLVLEILPACTETPRAAAEGPVARDCIDLPLASKPLVSVIIPASSSPAETNSCVRSVLRFEPDLAYEIILAGVRDADEAEAVGRWLPGAVMTRIAGPAGKATVWNQAVASARGEYLCFLGDHTQIQAGAISALVDASRADGDVGMVGARVVRSDGSLADAGEIVWRDGSVSSYGYSADPMLPEYNYRKECDAVSADCVLVPRPLWDRVGGCGEQFQSATYIAVDLAYRLRAIGCRVVYQPKATVVRLAAGAPPRQPSDQDTRICEADRGRLHAAWGRILAVESFPVGEEVFWARDRSRTRKTVVFIDQQVPTPDRDAGSRTLFQYLVLAAELGYAVKFLAGDFDYRRGYREALEERGIEILAGERYSSAWKSWFAERADRVHAVVFCRPHVTELFLDHVIRTCPSARRIYYGHDLHWVREEREYRITGKKEFARSAREWKHRECRILERMDCNLSISAEESRTVADLYPDRQHVVFPVFYWNDLARLQIQPDNRHGYLFVGGFAHRPNVDGLLWFLDTVWPIVRAAQPEATVHVIGSHAPTVISERTDAGLTFHGYVDDVKLASLYRSSRVALVPLRYGAGVKGKTVEALRHGLPVVSTSIGIEGLPDLPASLGGFDEPVSFASRAMAVYQDSALWQRQVADQFAYVRRWYSKDRAVQCLREAIEGRS